ncbi:MAG: hypothetical protein KAR19_11880 [Bacteroidales bacterium]|nr:hypothetical protein [Bacteroidales bacterium]
MGFGDAYLLKAGLRDKLIQPESHPGLKIIVTIPVYNESGLERCLDSLFQCRMSAAIQADAIQADAIRADAIRAEVLVLINASADSGPEILKQNRATCDATRSWIAAHPHPSISFFVLLDQSFGKKEAGVGMARKILMDEAVRRFSSIGAPDGIIASMDADAVVEKNYLEAIVGHFKSGLSDGCSIYFEHPLSVGTGDSNVSEDTGDSNVSEGTGDSNVSEGTGEAFGPEVYYAVTQYELHLRYYLQSVRSTGYPYAFHTVGSSFAVIADVYCKEGGMNRRQGGEDFYFIQKVAQRGNFNECNATCVFPSPRPSERVPFGTGPVVAKLIDQMQGAQLTTYDPRPFSMLRQLFSGLELMHSANDLDHFMKSQPEVLIGFLEENQFGEALMEIRKNSASFEAFQKRFWRWFNMFRIMKFLHHAREKGYPDIPVGAASLKLLSQINPEGVEIPPDGSDLKELLEIFRKLDRSSPR